MMSKKQESPKCPFCKGKTSVEDFYNDEWQLRYHVECWNFECLFNGPLRKTKHGAINAFARIQVKKSKKGE